jgi:hypothetical protein
MYQSSRVIVIAFPEAVFFANLFSQRLVVCDESFVRWFLTHAANRQCPCWGMGRYSTLLRSNYLSRAALPKKGYYCISLATVPTRSVYQFYNIFGGS